MKFIKKLLKASIYTVIAIFIIGALAQSGSFKLASGTYDNCVDRLSSSQKGADFINKTDSCASYK